jgi:hypothetical protein
LTQSIDKWKTILENQLDLDENENKEKKETSFDNILFPLVKSVFAKTIPDDLIFASEEEINEIKGRVEAENREGSIDSILTGENFTPKDYKDDEEYKELKKKGVKPMDAPKGELFYLDFQYGTQSNL